MRLHRCGLVAAVLLASAAASSADEDRVVAALKQRGATVERDEKRPGRPVVAVDFRNAEATDKDLKELAALTQLQKVMCLEADKLTSAGLKEFGALKQLRA